MYYSQIRIDPTNPEIAYQGGAPFFKTVDGGKTWRHGRRHSAQRSPRDLDQPARTTTTSCSATTAASTCRYDQGETWEYVNTDGRSASSTRSAPTCGSRTTCAAACRTTAAGAARARRAAANGILNSDWYPRRRRRRLLHAERSDRLDDRSTRNRRTATRTASICGPADRQRSVRGRAAPGRPRRRRRGGGSAGRRRLAARSSALGSRRQRRQRRAAAAARARTIRFYWSTPFILSPHNPRTVYLGADRLFRSYDRGDTWMASPDLTQQHRPQRSADHGRRRHGADGVEARRRRVVQQHRHDQRIAGRARDPLGRHQRRQRAGEPRRRRDLEERRRQRHGRAEGNARLARRSRRTSTPAPPTSRSTATAPTITSRTSS